MTGVVDTHRPVILDIYYSSLSIACVSTGQSVLTFHHGLKDAILYLFRIIQILDFSIELVIQLFGLVRASGAVKIRLIAFLRGSEKGKLRYYDNWAQLI